MYEKLKMFSNAKEVEDQLSRMLRKMVDVKSAFGSIDVIKIKYIKEVINEIYYSYVCSKVLTYTYIAGYVCMYIDVHNIHTYVAIYTYVNMRLVAS